MNPRHDASGDPLPPFALARLGTTRWRCRFIGIDDVAFSRDGATAYVTSTGVAAIDVATGRVRWSTAVPGACYCELLPDPAGDLLVTVGPGGSLSFLDAATGAPRAAIAQPSRSLVALAASHDAQTLLVGGFTRFGVLLNRDGSTRATLSIDRGQYLQSATFSPDDATVVTTDSDAAVALWSVADAKLIRSFGRADLEPNDAVFTPDGARLVVSTCSGAIVLYDVGTGDTVARWKAHTASASRVVVTPDGARAVSLGEDGAVSLWDLATHKRLATRRVARTNSALCLTPDGAAVAFGEGPRLVLLDLATFTERAPTTDHTVPIQALAVSRDDASVVTLAGTREARWWSMRDAAPLHTAPLAAYVTGLRPLPEPDRYAVTAATRDGNLELDLAARTLTPRAPPPDTHQAWRGRAVHATAFRGRLALTNAAGVVRSFKSETIDLLFTADDRYAVILDRSKVTCWDLAQHAAASVASVRSAAGLALAPTGDEVAAWTPRTLYRIGVPDGVERALWKAPTGFPIQGVVYAPAGDRLAVATDQDTRILDVATFRELARVDGPATSAATLAFTHDGTRLVTAGWDTTALIWSVDEAVAGHQLPPPTKPTKRGR